ncbi:hypothetical protein GMORB2_7063 [Geosmithia morbida]|uniref:Uncharacterized protein n=1 Tax=Geosmithia morbida TaxID=1094350 RepID=A0A9P4YW14_9HYPO|nr:uncharacterized protein GMORB2_7063 [Geosmithia morbida]KAF4122756.1 hypothetical protein GMORB2_7063 [Geosmithia morbida]
MSESFKPIDVVVPSTSYVDEMEERLQLARYCRDQVRQCDPELASYELNFMQLSVILTIDMHDLRNLSTSPGLVLYSVMGHTEMFLSAARAKTRVQEPTLVVDVSVEEPSEDPSTLIPAEAESSSNAAKRARSEEHAEGGAGGGSPPLPPPGAQGAPRGPWGGQARRAAEVKLV